MTRRLFVILLLYVFVLIFVAINFIEAAEGQKSLELQVQTKKWTGDLDGMVQRRAIRVLTVYSKTLYFVDNGQPRGIIYEAMKAFEEEFNKKRKTGNLRVHVVFRPVSRDELVKGLIEGMGDVACANMTVTEERRKKIDFSDPTFRDVSEIIITGPASPKISSLESLAGQEVYVRKSSSHYESLLKINQKFKQEGKKEIILKLAPEEFENEDLLEMLNAGLVKIIVSDSHTATFWKQVFPNITLHPDISIRQAADIAWAIRKNSPLLQAELNSFIKTHGKGTAFGNTLFQRYLKGTKFVKNAGSEAERQKFFKLTELFRTYSGKYNVDYILMMAQGYQESQLNQEAKSAVGAVGIMQIMPDTGNDLKVGDIRQVEPNIHGGVKYLRFMIDQYYKDEPMTDLNKALFTFASYNAGPGRIRSLRKETAARGLDPNIWFNNVERLASEKIGRETCTYVSNIYKYYIAYKLILEEQAKKEQLKKEMKSGS